MKISKSLFFYFATITQISLCLPPPVPASKFNHNQLELHRQLLKAIANNNINEVKSLVARGAIINAVEMGNVTPLAQAVEHEHEEICFFLITAGADVNKCIRHCTTPLMEAVRRGNTNIVKLLLTHGARVDNACRNMLFCAASNGYAAITKLLLECNDYYDQTARSTALIYAARNGHIETCKLLITHGADLNFTGIIQDNWENFLGERTHTTAFRAAARNGHFITWFVLMKAKVRNHLKYRA